MHYSDLYLSERDRYTGKYLLLSPISERIIQVKTLKRIINNYIYNHTGVVTTHGAMMASLAVLVNHQEIQKKIQKELDEVVGQSQASTHVYML